MSVSIPYLHPALLQPGLIEAAVYGNLEDHFYWSDCWDPAWYVELARKGFISICTEKAAGEYVLLPEMQRTYAVLDWTGLRAGRTTRRALRGEETGRAGLVLERDTAAVCAGIRRAYGEHCWLHPPYVELLRALEGRELAGFALWAVELRRADGRLAGGELGYTIGRVYTSLSGFLDRGDGRNNHLGKAQLYGLAGLLHQAGYGFWNLGHPYMQYKLDLGARVLDRREFLDRWLPAVAGGVSRMTAGGSDGLADRRVPGGLEAEDAAGRDGQPGQAAGQAAGRGLEALAGTVWPLDQAIAWSGLEL